MKDIRALPIAKFPSLEKQEIDVIAIRETKQKAAELEQLCLKKLRALDELKKSILQKAFSGELTKDDKGAAA